MSKKTMDEYTAEAQAELEPIMSASPGVLEVMAIMEGFDRSNQGAEAYEAFVRSNVFVSTTNTASR